MAWTFCALVCGKDNGLLLRFHFEKYGLLLVTLGWKKFRSEAECKSGQCTNSPNLDAHDDRTPLLVDVGKKEIT